MKVAARFVYSRDNSIGAKLSLAVILMPECVVFQFFKNYNMLGNIG